MQHTEPFIILIDKPTGISSHTCLQRVKRLLNVKKMGHTGSLDPLASGMLPICANRATKCADFLLTSDKMYLVGAQLGATTTTGDAEGERLTQQSVPHYADEEILNTLELFIGSSTQVPPMYSALKHQGQPLYRLARKGIHVERQPRSIHIYDIQLQAYDPASQTLVLRVHCSKGTYIRTLIEDIGKQLGCGAFVATLRREAVGAFTPDRMISVQDLEIYIQKQRLDNAAPFIVSLSEVFHSYPVIELSEAEFVDLQHGRPYKGLVSSHIHNTYALYHQERCVGVLQVDSMEQCRITLLQL